MCRLLPSVPRRSKFMRLSACIALFSTGGPRAVDTSSAPPPPAYLLLFTFPFPPQYILAWHAVPLGGVLHFERFPLVLVWHPPPLPLSGSWTSGPFLVLPFKRSSPAFPILLVEDLSFAYLSFTSSPRGKTHPEHVFRSLRMRGAGPPSFPHSSVVLCLSIFRSFRVLELSTLSIFPLLPGVVVPRPLDSACRSLQVRYLLGF